MAEGCAGGANCGLGEACGDGEEVAEGCCGDAAGGGAVGCGVGCVVWAKPNGRKKTKPANSDLKEGFLIVRGNSGSGLQW